MLLNYFSKKEINIDMSKPLVILTKYKLIFANIEILLKMDDMNYEILDPLKRTKNLILLICDCF